MILKRIRIITIFILLSILLTACGGGGGSSNSSTAPTAVITAADELVEGTTFTTLDASSSSDSNGTIASYLWMLEDNGGIPGLDIDDSSSVSTQLTGLPAVLTTDISITVSLVVTDNDDESSSKVTKTIILKNNTVVVEISDFDGEWFSPCFNNVFGFSVRQTLNINGTSLTSDIQSYTAGNTPAPNCILPSSGILVTSDATANLSFGPNVSTAKCSNGSAVDTDINVTSVESSGNSFTGASEISDALALLTGYGDILPNTSLICRVNNGNLLFGSVEYTRGANTSNIDLIEANVDSEVSWQVGDSIYTGGASALSTNTSGSNNFGVLVVGTDNDLSNGAFSGSSLNITHSLSGTGLYTIVDSLGTNQDKVITLTTTVGISTVAATAYNASATNNRVEVFVDDDGKYHFTLSNPISMNKGVEVGGGVPNAPATLNFTMFNIYDFLN